MEEKAVCNEVAPPGQPEFRVLVVDDDLDNQVLLKRLMVKAGVLVEGANNGKQGVEVFQAWRPHLIWMDRRMPVMDGLKATEAIRALPDGKDVRIVAVTASTLDDQRAEMLEAGMDDVVRKPYDLDEIYNCMSRLLGAKFYFDPGAKPR